MHTKLFAVVVLFLAGIAPALATPNIQHWQSPSGARVYFVENHDLPMLDLTVTFAAGSSFDVAEKSGLAGLTHKMLDLGAEGLSEDDIARNLADIGAQLGMNFDADRAGVSLRTLSSSCGTYSGVGYSGTSAATSAISRKCVGTRKDALDRGSERS